MNNKIKIGKKIYQVKIYNIKPWQVKLNLVFFLKIVPNLVYPYFDLGWNLTQALMYLSIQQSPFNSEWSDEIVM
jgi:hypothetical protein